MRKVTIVREGGALDTILADSGHLDFNTDVLTFSQGEDGEQMKTAPMFRIVAQYNWNLVIGYMWHEALEPDPDELAPEPEEA